MSNKRFYSGKYDVRNKGKYKGDYRNVIYRSSWELRFLIYCDRNPNILQFSSEETVIPYLSPVDDKIHRYFVDFWIKVQTTKGTKEFLVEIKPKSQTKEPKMRQRKTKRYLSEALTYETNQAKWGAARAYCVKHGMEFLVLTEDDLLP